MTSKMWHEEMSDDEFDKTMDFLYWLYKDDIPPRYVSLRTLKHVKEIDWDKALTELHQDNTMENI